MKINGAIKKQDAHIRMVQWGCVKRIKFRGIQGVCIKRDQEALIQKVEEAHIGNDQGPHNWTVQRSEGLHWERSVDSYKDDPEGIHRDVP